MKQKTTWTKENDIQREWYLVDVKDQILGRAATKIAALLIGKGKVNRVANLDAGDYVVVVNSQDIKLTRGKETKKMYYSHSTYPGGFKEIRFDKAMLKDPTFAVREAVKGMLPKTKMKDQMMARLLVFADTNHKHDAQKPKEYKL